MSSIILGMHYDLGQRELYEDRVDVQTVQTAGGLQLAVALVADGVGGENKGERAAQLAKDAIISYLRQGQETNVPALLTQAVQYANQLIHQEVKDSGNASTTLALAVIAPGNTLFIANVGDSRIYLCRNNKLTQLTIDHNFATIMPWQNKLSPEVARQHPRADVLMRALGPKADVVVDTGFYVGTTDYRTAGERGLNGLPLKEGDAILVCSDGLIKLSPQTKQPYATEEEIVQVLTTQEGEKAARSLVSFALGRNADDNVSAGVLQMPDPSRHRRALAPLYRWGAIGLVAALVVIGLIAFLLNRQATGQVEEAQAASAAQQTVAAETAIASNITATAINQHAAQTATANAANTSITATANAINFSGTATAQNEAIKVTETAIALAEIAQETKAAEDTLCVRIENYNLNILSPDPTFSPALPVMQVQGNPALSINVTWQVENNGLCPWYNVRLRSLNTQAIYEPLDLGDIRPGTSTHITIKYRPPQFTNDLNDEWVFVVQSPGGDLPLLDLPHLILKKEGWYFIVTPTPTITNTPSPSPTLTNTPKQSENNSNSATNTPKPPTNTPKPPTNTPKPPTNTPEPPTNTPEPPTNTPEPPTNTPEPIVEGTAQPTPEATTVKP